MGADLVIGSLVIGSLVIGSLVIGSSLVGDSLPDDSGRFDVDSLRILPSISLVQPGARAVLDRFNLLARFSQLGWVIFGRVLFGCGVFDRVIFGPVAGFGTGGMGGRGGSSGVDPGVLNDAGIGREHVPPLGTRLVGAFRHRHHGRGHRMDPCR